MTNELLTLFDYYEMEKGINRDTMVEALETALLSASKKSIGPARELRIHVDPDKGEIKAFATLLVKDSVSNPYDEIDIFTARRLQPGIGVDEELEVDITPANFGRIAAQTAKQTMMQRLRMAEKEMIYDEFKDRAGDIVSGTVRRFERGDVWIDLGKFEGVMRQRERVNTEEYNVGDRIRAYVVAVENGARGPEILLSRSHPNFVRRLFESEVSEIADRTVEIRSLAREAGYRTKVAVHSADERVDPVGACVGMRGARVKNIVRELNNEKVDIIRWSEDIRGFVEEALKPARIKTITLDEEEKSVRVTVEEEELSKAIGRRGQNARLTARLVGWDVQVQKDESAHEAMLAQIEAASEEIAAATEIDVNTARILVEGGVSTLQMLATGIDEVDIADILGLSVEEGATILARARATVGVPDGEEGGEAEEPAEAEVPAEESADDKSDPSGQSESTNEAGTEPETAEAEAEAEEKPEPEAPADRTGETAEEATAEEEEAPTA